MKQWNLLPSDIDPSSATGRTEDVRSFALGDRGWCTVIYFALYTDETGAVAQPPQAIRLRILCHLILDSLTEEGLQEAGDYLRDMFEFYKPSKNRPALPSPSFSVPAKVGETYDRPSFLFLEE